MTPYTTVTFAPFDASASVVAPMCFGMALPRGKKTTSDLETVVVETVSGSPVSSYTEAAAYWSDGSVRWAHVYVLIPDSAGCDGRLNVGWRAADDIGLLPSRITTKEWSNGTVELTTSAARYQCRASESGPEIQATLPTATGCVDFVLKPVVQAFSEGVSALSAGHFHLTKSDNPLIQVVSWSGKTVNEGSSDSISVRWEATIFAQSGLVSVRLTVHNPLAARHRGGCWDLGDSASAPLFGAAICVSPVEEVFASYSIRCESQESTVETGPEFLVQQYSSGGENWRSNAHVDAANSVNLPYAGYRLITGGRKLREGRRADPLVEARVGNTSVGLTMERFWQNFPSAIRAGPTCISIEFFPTAKESPVELQGGERKMQSAWLNFGADADSLAWVHTTRFGLIDGKAVADSNAVPLFDMETLVPELQGLVDDALGGSTGFFAKREVVDEYGWRHFGDLYADHETLNYQGELPLISHYNNQYDPIESFWREALRRDHLGWMQLAVELADHVVDIDIYHTTEDRSEYNGGLFWHTDHYVHAHTATHRTYSRHNETSCDGAVGGGPGSEHCYTSGLASLYFLTGDRRYREAALGLASWIERLHEGDGAILQLLERLVRKELKTFGALLLRHRVPKFRYPFTRGTGNYVNAMVDGYLLTGERRFLTTGANIIRMTAHPAELPAERDLLDIERNWSYLIMLQSVCRFIAVCRSDSLEADSAEYCQQLVLVFAKWMADSEQPFLSQAALLDFPNETWAAQDIRKAWVLSAAAKLDSSAFRQEFEERSCAFESYVAGALNGRPNAAHTRIIVLLMQSRVADTRKMPSTETSNASGATFEFASVPTWTITSFVMHLLTRFGSALLALSLRRELKWFRSRFADRLNGRF